MKVIPRLLFVLTVCSQVFPQTAAKPVHQNCAGPNVPFSVCAAIYADGTTLYATDGEIWVLLPSSWPQWYTEEMANPMSLSVHLFAEFFPPQLAW